MKEGGFRRITFIFVEREREGIEKGGEDKCEYSKKCLQYYVGCVDARQESFKIQGVGNT